MWLKQICVSEPGTSDKPPNLWLYPSQLHSTHFKLHRFKWTQLKSYHKNSSAIPYKCWKRSCAMWTTESSKVRLPCPPNQQTSPSRLTLPAPLVISPNCPVDFTTRIISLVFNLHFCRYTVRFVLPFLWQIMVPKKMSERKSYPCGVDVIHSALILPRGTSIIIQEALPFFPHWNVWCTSAFSGQKEAKYPVLWFTKQSLGNHSHLQKKASINL